jgi:hypothetical protein
VAARQTLNYYATQIEREKSRYAYGAEDLFKREIEEISLKYQLMSKHTSFLAVNKNDQKPVEELKEVVISRDMYKADYYGLECCAEEEMCE